MLLVLLVTLLGLSAVIVPTADAAAFIVAANNSLDAAKAKADVVCPGVNDQNCLAASMKLGPLLKTGYDDNAWTNAYSSQSVEWLPGDYYLSATLIIPQSVDSVLHAEGAIFHYQPSTGDAVVVSGCLRCRFYFGTIWTHSNGGALAFKDRPYTNPFMPILMSVFHFQGLQQDPPNGNNGVGLWLTKHFCTNKVEGTDIRGFAMGVFVDDRGEGKIDTNWYWLSYVRGNGQNIVVQGSGVDSQQWQVNVDSTLPGSVAIRTAASNERWQIIMGTLDRSPGTRSIILDPGAQWNWMEIFPPLWNFDGYENHSNHPNNLFAQLPHNAGKEVSNNNTIITRKKKSGNQTHQVLGFQSFNDGPGFLEEELTQQLQTVQNLFNKGLITDEEYTAKKQELIARI
jgi:hypothetical protein